MAYLRFFVLLVAAVFAGCSRETPPVAPVSETTQAVSAESDETAETAEADPMNNLLKLAGEQKLDAAIEYLLNDAPENWVESTSLQEFKISESEFGGLSQLAKAELQQKFIDRVGEIKGLSRAMIDRATETKNQGDEETARRYVEAVNRLGTQLRDADIVLVFKQTGSALATATTPD